MKLCVFDDEIQYQNILSDIIEDYFDIHHSEMEYTVKCFSKALNLIDYVKENKTEVIFLDIVVPGNEDEGLLIAREIRKFDTDSHIIFVTSYKEKIVRSFDGLVRPTAYLTKPIQKNEIHDLLKNIVRQRIESDNCISFKFGKAEYLLYANEIYALHKLKHKMVVMTNNRTIEVVNTINSLMDVLPENFVKINQGTIVNLDFVKKIDYADRRVILVNDVCYTISRNSKVSVKKAVDSVIKRIV